MGFGATAIAEVDGIASAVLRKARRGTDPGPLPGTLVSLRFDIEENLLLQRNRTECAENPEVHALSIRSAAHLTQGVSGLRIERHAGTNAD